MTDAQLLHMNLRQKTLPNSAFYYSIPANKIMAVSLSGSTVISLAPAR